MQDIVLALLDGIRTIQQVAKEADVTAQYVSSVISRNKLHDKLARSRSRRGTAFRADLRMCTIAEAVWVRANTPEGGTVGDLMLALVRDAMAEEQ